MTNFNPDIKQFQFPGLSRAQTTIGYKLTTATELCACGNIGNLTAVDSGTPEAQNFRFSEFGKLGCTELR